MKKREALSLALNLSWTMVFALVIPLLAGVWLDKKLDTTPLFIIIGMVLGILTATLGVARMTIRTFARIAPENVLEEEGPVGEEEPE